MPSCKCCGQNAGFLGAVDFNKTCEDHKGPRIFPVPGPTVPYHRCAACGFIFTDYCDRWTPAMFAEHIYNAEYARADPDFVTGGRAAIAEHLARFLSPSRQGLKVLDYGAGGNPGHLGRRLIELGFDVTSYDPFYDAALRPTGPFDVVFSVEVIEHCHRPDEVARDMAQFLSETGLLFVSTLLHPHPAGADVLRSWYIAPRNGHISIFTVPAITCLFREAGINMFQSLFGLIGFKKLPSFPTQVFV